MGLSIGIIICIFYIGVESTDLAVIYKHDILIMQNADLISQNLPLHPEQLELSHNLDYPIALAFQPSTSTFLVSDMNNKLAEIMSISVRNKTAEIKTILKKQGASVVESISYDQLRQRLFWTDSRKHGIYSFNLSSSQPEEKIATLITDRNVNKPRGITVDYCNEKIYWTERDERKPSIETFDLKKQSHEPMKVAEENIYFQGIHYNHFNNELIWAETMGDDQFNSSCTIIVKSLKTGEESVVQSIDGCYPFALTSDKNHIYWSDLNQGGVMRLSRNNPKDNLVKLIKTPAVNKTAIVHFGALGVAVMQEHHPNEKLCPEMKKEEVRQYMDESDKDESDKNESDKDESHKNESHKDESDNEAELENAPSRSTDSVVPTETSEREESKKEFPAMSNSASSFKSGPRYHQLHILLILVSVACLCFMISTIVLLLKNLASLRSCFDAVRGLCCLLQITSPPTSSATVEKPSKSHRRFGAKPKRLDDHACPKLAEDGVNIDIEDCCQMTLCETPCYTSWKKEGRGYNNKDTKPTKWTDKERLISEDNA